MRTSAKSAPARPASPKARRQLRSVRLGVILLLVALASLFEPRVFRFVFGGLLKAEAWRHGATVDFQRIEGSFFEPVIVLGSRWAFQSETGATTRVEIARLEALFAWKNLFRGTNARCFQRLTLTGITGKIFLPLEEQEDDLSGSRRWHAWRPAGGGPLPMPAVFEGEAIDFIFQSENDYVRIEDGRFRASEVEPGEVHASRVTLKQPWLARSFRNVQGTTALQGSKIVLANLVLAPGLELRSLSAELSELAQGRLDLNLDVAAFGGSLQAHTGTVPAGGGLTFDAGGKFEQINIAQLASFLSLTDAAGGTIRDGNFSFRGSPRNPSKATAKLRLDATNFQWESRQWDSLSLGLVLEERRLQVPRFELRQGNNTLSASGELTLPGAEQKWWQGEFNGAVKARIENLTELSALLLPEFKYAAGKVNIDGQVRGHGEEWDGQLLLEGSKLTWRNAPIQTAHAAVKLSGKELRVARIELVNGDDYLRGSGVVNLFGPTQYWGELRVAVEDLAAYAAFLQKPVLPEPLAGGAIIDWTGEGSAIGQSGKFMARLRKVRSLGALAQRLHPINAALEGSYGAGSMHFTKFALSDDDSSFAANITIGSKALHLTGVRLLHKEQLWLEGEALLPLDLWQQWPNVALAQLLTDAVPCRVQLTAHALELEAASQLTGWKFPISGILDGTLRAEGAINALKLDGQLTLANGTIPLGWNGDVLTGLDARVAFAESTARIENFIARYALGDMQIAGSIQLANLRAPELQLTLRAPAATFPLFQGTDPKLTVEAALELQIDGPLNEATVRGTASLASLALDLLPDITPLWRADDLLKMPRLFTSKVPLFANWHFDVAAKSARPEGLKSGRSVVLADLRVTGTGLDPLLAGSVEMREVAVLSGGHEFSLPHVVVTFPGSGAAEPSLDLTLLGEFCGAPVRASATGPLQHLLRLYEGPLPLTDAMVRDLLAGKLAPATGDFSLEVRLPAAVESFASPVPPAEVKSSPNLSAF